MAKHEHKKDPVEEVPTDSTPVEQDLDALRAELEKLNLERDELQAQVLRTMADFQNFRKRTRQEAALLREMANENLVVALLPVLDNFERTVQHLQAGASLEAMVEGVGAVEKQLRTVLEGQKVKRIPTVGEPFDPTYHEAIGTEVREDVEDHTIVAEAEAGYQMGDRVVRPARVKVATRP